MRTSAHAIALCAIALLYGGTAQPTVAVSNNPTFANKSPKSKKARKRAKNQKQKILKGHRGKKQHSGRPA